MPISFSFKSAGQVSARGRMENRGSLEKRNQLLERSIYKIIIIRPAAFSDDARTAGITYC